METAMNELDIKEILCKGFCSGITVSNSGGLINVTAPFEINGGDLVNLYVVPSGEGNYRIEDDGSFIPMIMASGVNLLDGSRNEEFKRILSECRLSYNTDTGELASNVVASQDLGVATMDFITAVLKLDALSSPLSTERVANMFRDDVRAAVSEAFEGKAAIVFDEPISATLEEFTPDIILRPNSGKHTAIYAVTSDTRAWEAIALRYKAVRQAKLDCNVIGIMDKVNSGLISNRSIANVTNNLDGGMFFYGSRDSAMTLIGEKVGIAQQQVH